MLFCIPKILKMYLLLYAVTLKMNGEQEIFAVAGTTLFVPRDTPHSLLNIGTNSAKLISVLTPGVHDGFVLNVPSAEKAGASNEQLSEIAGNYGAVILGPKQSYNNEP